MDHFAQSMAVYVAHGKEIQQMFDTTQRQHVKEIRIECEEGRKRTM